MPNTLLYGTPIVSHIHTSWHRYLFNKLQKSQLTNNLAIKTKFLNTHNTVLKCGIAMPVSFSSNGTSSLCSKVEGEVVSSSPIGCVCNLPIKKQCVIAFVINSIRGKLEEKMKNYEKLSIHPKFLLKAEIDYVIFFFDK
jgi:hypothetical protein